MWNGGDNSVPRRKAAIRRGCKNRRKERPLLIRNLMALAPDANLGCRYKVLGVLNKDHTKLRTPHSLSPKLRERRRDPPAAWKEFLQNIISWLVDSDLRSECSSYPPASSIGRTSLVIPFHATGWLVIYKSERGLKLGLDSGSGRVISRRSCSEQRECLHHKRLKRF